MGVVLPQTSNFSIPREVAENTLKRGAHLADDQSEALAHAA